MKIKFTKMHGLGNDFIMLNGFNQELPEHEEMQKLAKACCHRRFGIGADGILPILPSDVADYKMLIYNSDGSIAEMCGNGIRCAALFAKEEGICNKDHVTVETLAGIKIIDIKDGLVTVDMGKPFIKANDVPFSIPNAPSEKVLDYPIEIDGVTYKFSPIGMGNPHCVIFIDEKVMDFPVTTIGPKIETHSYFPAKTNVEFVNVIDRKHLDMRVWERGCGETFACGTGSCATAVASILTGRTDNEIDIKLLGGTLHISYNEGGSVFMTGPATKVIESIIDTERFI